MSRVTPDPPMSRGAKAAAMSLSELVSDAVISCYMVPTSDRLGVRAEPVIRVTVKGQRTPFGWSEWIGLVQVKAREVGAGEPPDLRTSP